MATSASYVDNDFTACRRRTRQFTTFEFRGKERIILGKSDWKTTVERDDAARSRADGCMSSGKYASLRSVHR